MNILIVYATNSGGTQEAAGIVRDVLNGAGHTVDLKRAYHVQPNDLSPHDLVVLGSCTWDNFVDGKRIEGQLQEHMQTLADAMQAGQFSGKKFALFALGDSSYNTFCGAADRLEALVVRIGGTQTGATLRIDGYFFQHPVHRKRVAEWAAGLLRPA